MSDCAWVGRRREGKAVEESIEKSTYITDPLHERADMGVRYRGIRCITSKYNAPGQPSTSTLALFDRCEWALWVPSNLGNPL